MLGITWARGAIKVGTREAIDLFCWSERTSQSRGKASRGVRGVRVAQGRTPAVAQENHHRPRSRSALSTRRPWQVTKPPRRKCSSLDSFPRERISCVVICSKHRPRELRSPGDCAIVIPLKDVPPPRGLVSLGEVLFVKLFCRTSVRYFLM